MTINFTPSGGSAQSLAGAEGDGADGPLGLDGGVETVVQLENIVRATKPAVFDRGNYRARGGFTARKKHASYDAAMTYWRQHLAAVKGVGSLVFTDGAGSLSLTDAAVSASGRVIGATTEWQYQWEGSL